MLLIGAGVMVASLQKVLAVDPGFRTEGVLTGLISPPQVRYPERSRASPPRGTTAGERPRALPEV